MKAIVLAAGKGKRMDSEGAGIPKVMQTAKGKPLLAYVLDSISFLDKSDIIIVAGYKKESVTEAFPAYTYAVQQEQRGTGHAVMAARDLLEGFSGNVLVCYGDMPLLKRNSYLALINEHERAKNDCTILTGEFDELMDFGRIVRNPDGSFLRIVEAKDSDTQTDKIREYNSGVYLFSCMPLLNALNSLSNNNAQGEYYLTDVPAIIAESGGKTGLLALRLGTEILGVNTPEDLSRVEALL